MRVRHLLSAGLLAIALFASSVSFAAAHETGATATFDSFHPATNEMSATTASTSYKEVPLVAADWAVSVSSQAFVAVTSHPSVSPQKLVAMSTPEAGNDGGGGQIIKLNYVIGARAGPAIATASAKLAPGVLSNYSGLFVQLAPTGGGVLSNYGNVSVGFKHFDGLQRTEHIVLSAAAQFATVKETVGA